ncbi:sensor histidine kinase [Paenibacillus cellulositrophicus]|uniref:sensor histidine kinase n=1 Tax=Paenibacillus cellulositrophicus TaxID=562959 RepID=UPI0012677FB9|nr:sensor histidine kinase [Paenibacillus cellulositrophicus]
MKTENGLKQRTQQNRYNDNLPDTLVNARVPSMTWVLFIYFLSMFVQLLHEPSLIALSFFSGLMILHASLIWHFSSLTDKYPWVYFLIQGLIIMGCALIMDQATPLLILGLYPVLTCQSVGVYYHKIKMVMLSVFYYVLLISTLFIMGQLEMLILLSILYVMITVILVSFADLFLKQVHARIRTQAFLEDLGRAHRKVEELTLSNERQRMARDLHDTLAQGLAGIIMQLDAVDAHLTKGNNQRAQEIVQHSMIHAKKTLSEARLAIDNLRSKTFVTVDFSDAVHEEVERFKNATGIQVFLDMSMKGGVSKLMMEHGLYIIGECLTNVARHAKASHVWVCIHIEDENMKLEIKDDGIGIASNQKNSMSGHYGLIGMKERVRILGGSLIITNNIPCGTVIKIDTTDKKGETT